MSERTRNRRSRCPSGGPTLFLELDAELGELGEDGVVDLGYHGDVDAAGGKGTVQAFQLFLIVSGERGKGTVQAFQLFLIVSGAQCSNLSASSVALSMAFESALRSNCPAD